ncbi:MAG: 3'-5' exonuclease [Xanthomonadaceae bacterium]|nr:3'-5' exonuclease [Xanthomonadaceae bacterium]
MQFSRPFVVLDFETTGVSHRSGDRITEVAALRVHDGAVVERFTSLVNCGVRVPPWIADYTGISQAMVDGAPPVAEVLPRLVRFLGDDVIVAHNAGFDRGFLDSECVRAGLVRGTGEFACSVRLSRRLLPGLRSYSLAAIAHHVGIAPHGRAHRAEADAMVTYDLAMALVRRAAATWKFERFDPQLFVLTQKLPVRTVAPLFAAR